MKSRTRVAQALLVTDAAVLFVYGLVSLLLTPGSPGEPYLSWGRMLYGVLPTALGLGSFGCAVWLALGRSGPSPEAETQAR
jgi:hypothetical protein